MEGVTGATLWEFAMSAVFIYGSIFGFMGFLAHVLFAFRSEDDSFITLPLWIRRAVPQLLGACGLLGIYLESRHPVVDRSFINLAYTDVLVGVFLREAVLIVQGSLLIIYTLFSTKDL